MTRLAAIVLLGLLGSEAAAETRPELGRLFTTPAERADLDRDRRQPRRDDAASTPPDAAGDVPPNPASFTVNGLVSRGDGRRLVWINGAMTENGGVTPEGVRVLPDWTATGAVPLLLPGRPAPVVLKPGQTFDGNSGARREAFIAATPTDTGQGEAHAGADR